MRADVGFGLACCLLVALTGCGDADQPPDAAGPASSTVAVESVAPPASSSPSTSTTPTTSAAPPATAVLAPSITSSVTVAVPAPSPPPTVTGAVPPPVITVPPADAIEQAAIVGPLSLTGGCLYVNASEGGPGVVIFSYGTTWDPTTSSVVNPDGSTVTVGQTLSASGGGHPIADLAGWQLADRDVLAVQSCAGSAGVTLFYVVGNVAVGG